MTGIDRSNAITVFNGDAKTPAATFRKDCPEHGCVCASTREMKPVRIKRWITKNEAPRARMLPGVTLLRRSPDRQQAEIEFDQWELGDEITPGA